MASISCVRWRLDVVIGEMSVRVLCPVFNRTNAQVWSRDSSVLPCVRAEDTRGGRFLSSWCEVPTACGLSVHSQKTRFSIHDPWDILGNRHCPMRARLCDPGVCLSHEGLLSEAEGGNKAGEFHVHVVRGVSRSVRRIELTLGLHVFGGGGRRVQGTFTQERSCGGRGSVDGGWQ